MNQIEALKERLAREFPDARLELSAPLHDDGVWLLDAAYSDHALCVEWRASRGFGLSSLPSEGYGEHPEELYRSIEDAFARASELLHEGGRPSGPQAFDLRKLREQARVSQAELASRLGMQQAAVSKLERRGEVSVHTLRRFIEALGGKLELHACFHDREVLLELAPPE